MVLQQFTFILLSWLLKTVLSLLKYDLPILNKHDRCVLIFKRPNLEHSLMALFYFTSKIGLLNEVVNEIIFWSFSSSFLPNMDAIHINSQRNPDLPLMSYFRHYSLYIKNSCIYASTGMHSRTEMIYLPLRPEPVSQNEILKFGVKEPYSSTSASIIL